VLWGFLHGVYLVAERGWRGSGERPVAQPALFATAFTFVAVTLTWIPFRAPDLGVAAAMLRALFDFRRDPGLDALAMLGCLGAMALTVLWHWRLRDSSLEDWYGGMRPLAQGGALSICLLTVFLASGGDQRAFIYFQF